MPEHTFQVGDRVRAKHYDQIAAEGFHPQAGSRLMGIGEEMWRENIQTRAGFITRAGTTSLQISDLYGMSYSYHYSLIEHCPENIPPVLNINEFEVGDRVRVCTGAEMWERHGELVGFPMESLSRDEYDHPGLNRSMVEYFGSERTVEHVSRETGHIALEDAGWAWSPSMVVKVGQEAGPFTPRKIIVLAVRPSEAMKKFRIQHKDWMAVAKFIEEVEPEARWSAGQRPTDFFPGERNYVSATERGRFICANGILGGQRQIIKPRKFMRYCRTGKIEHES